MKFPALPVHLILLSFIPLPGCGTSLSRGVSRPTASTPTMEVILTDLDNPRGVVIFESGDLLVTEVGTGYRSADPTMWTGKLTQFSDLNGDGDFDDEAEAQQWFSRFRAEWDNQPMGRNGGGSGIFISNTVD